MTTPIERLADLIVGQVESVSADEIRVLLDVDAPHSTALNTGVPTTFPRLNSYVLVPNEAGATVGYIVGIGVESSPYPKRSGFKDFGLIDLPFPLRKMTVSPVGTLTCERERAGGTKYRLSRGIVAFPSVGDQVLMPTPAQVEAIVGSSDTDRRVRLGASPLAANAAIMVDPDKIFGRHLAVLGNTGSGKSCTVAGLIRWSLESAKAEREAKGLAARPNARFIVLDPNGEYARAFRDLGESCRVFRLPPITTPERPLDVPAWLWNGHEWSAVAHAQPGVQRPLLMQGLRELKSGHTEGVPREAIIRRYLVSYSLRIATLLTQGTQAFGGSVRARFDAAGLLERIALDTVEFSGSTSGQTAVALQGIATRATEVVDSRRSGKYFNDFAVTDLESVRDLIDALVGVLPQLDLVAPIGEDAPLPFDVNLLADHLERIASEQGGSLASFIATLKLRIRAMLADQRLSAVIAREPPVSLEAWLTDYVGASDATNGQVTLIDLSLVPSDVVQVVVAVLARLVFEALQRYRKTDAEGRPLPTVLVLEEAHTFARRGRDEESDAVSPGALCREIFERIAREGRKFGLGLVLSSQRPFELSPTVLAQCNTFLLHRIVNDIDQNLVSRLVPDNIGGLLRELPSLPSRQAILLGWAAPIPVLVEISELPIEQGPQSEDPDFWDVWTGSAAREVAWTKIANDWRGVVRGKSLAEEGKIDG